MSEVKNLGIDELVSPAVSVRTAIDPELLEDLVDSIRRVGIIQPLVVRRVGDKYEIVAGIRRYEAARIASVPIVPCVIRDFDEESADVVRIEENLIREDVNPTDECKYFLHMMKVRGCTVEDLAKMFGRSTNYVYARLSVSKMSDDFVSAISEGKISLTIALELWKIENEQERGRCLRQAIEGGCSLRTARAWRSSGGYFEEQHGDSRAADQTGPHSDTTLATKRVCPLCSSEVGFNEAEIFVLCKRCVEKLKK